MGKSTTEELRSIMDLKHNIRNMSLIGHIGHGKTTLTESLVAAAGDVHLTDTHADEAERSITIKSTGISLSYEMTDVSLKAFKGERNGNKYLINLIDSPGHPDFSSEVGAALRITDGAVVVIDRIEGFRDLTQTALYAAFLERIRPVFTINKMDRCFLDPEVDGEEAYLTLKSVIKDTNHIMAVYENPVLGDVKAYPEKGNVAFSSGLHGWAFTLTTFAKMYASKFGVDESKMSQRLWGESYFDPKSKKWTTESTGSATCKRGFVQFCFEPIKQIINTCMNDEKDLLWPMLTKLGVTMNAKEKELTGKALMKCVMQKWLPAASALLEMIIFHLPSPHTAQRYRVENLYKGPLDDQYANAIRNCDPNGPLMLYVSKMIPASDDKGRFFAFGRVFSGRVSTGMKIRIMGPNYVQGETKDLYVESVQRTVIWMGKKRETVKDVPCGNTVALVGLDHFISKSATLTNEKETEAYPIRAMRFSMCPVVSVAVQCKVASDLPKLVEGLKCLAKSDPLVVCTIEESGERIIAGAGELHLKTCLKDLQDDFMGGVEILASDPFVSFRETVLEKSSRTVMSKSENKHNRLYMRAIPTDIIVADAIEDGKIGPGDDPEFRESFLSKFGWEKDIAKKIWCFGPKRTGPNMVVDKCKGVEYLNEIKDSVVAGFQCASEVGVLAEEKMRGICFELCDAVLHADAIHRGGGQVIPTVQRVIYAAQLTAKPRLVEPLYSVGIQAPEQALGVIHSVVNKRRGHVFNERQRPRLGSGTPLYNIKALLPVVESFGFYDLMASTSGQAFPHCVYDHWEMIESDPMEAGSLASNFVCQIRKRKGLKEQITPLSDFEDNL